jgi:hypothetical protein
MIRKLDQIQQNLNLNFSTREKFLHKKVVADVIRLQVIVHNFKKP